MPHGATPPQTIAGRLQRQNARHIAAVQRYGYKCPCTNDGQFVDFLGNPITILREVGPNGAGGWKYSVKKSGKAATIDPLP